MEKIYLQVRYIIMVDTWHTYKKYAREFDVEALLNERNLSIVE